MVDHLPRKWSRINWGALEVEKCSGTLHNPCCEGANTGITHFLQENISTGEISTLHATDEIVEIFTLWK